MQVRLYRSLIAHCVSRPKAPSDFFLLTNCHKMLTKYAQHVDKIILLSGDGDFDLLLDRVKSDYAVSTEVYGVEPVRLEGWLVRPVSGLRSSI